MNVEHEARADRSIESRRNRVRRGRAAGWTGACALAAILLTGCEYPYSRLRMDGQQAVLDGEYGKAREVFMKCQDRKPGDAENLHDVAAMSYLIAKQRFDEHNAPAGLREVDRAIDFYGRAIMARPNYPAAMLGRNSAFELKGDFEKALKQAEWGTRYIGPMARQYIFLAREHEERGDLDLARLRYRQAIAVEPASGEAHQAYAEFLERRNQSDEAAVERREAERLSRGASRPPEPVKKPDAPAATPPTQRR